MKYTFIQEAAQIKGLVKENIIKYTAGDQYRVVYSLTLTKEQA